LASLCFEAISGIDAAGAPASDGRDLLGDPDAQLIEVAL
jgi:hypothetical protein